MTPHPAACAQRRTLGVRIRSNAYALSQKARRRIEEIFGWSKTTGCFRKSRHRGLERTHAAGQYVVAACNLVRMAKLSLGPPVLLGPKARDACGVGGRKNGASKRLKTVR